MSFQRWRRWMGSFQAIVALVPGEMLCESISDEARVNRRLEPDTCSPLSSPTSQSTDETYARHRTKQSLTRRQPLQDQLCSPFYIWPGRPQVFKTDSPILVCGRRSATKCVILWRQLFQEHSSTRLNERSKNLRKEHLEICGDNLIEKLYFYFV